ncbi:MFS transporter [Kocuria nitroreducens]|uniref:MFS transporter n=1 Tax=Kocuria nitroreducens TaxID=3058914 RepID=UPI0036DE30A1
MATTAATAPRAAEASLLPLVVLGLCGFISVTTQLLPSGLLTRIASDLDIGIPAAGTLTSVYAVAIVVTVLPLTRLTLHIPRRVLFTAVLGTFAAGNVLVALSPVLTVAIAGRVLSGISHGLLWAVVAPTVAHLTAPDRVGRAMAIVFAGTSLGLAVGAPLGTLLGQALGWRTMFLILAGISATLAALTFLTLPDVRAGSARPLSLVRALRLPGVPQIITGWAMLMLAHFAVFTYISPFLADLGVGVSMVGAAIAVLGFSALLGIIVAGRVRPRALYAGMLGAPMLMLITFLGLAVLPLGMVSTLVLLWAWGLGYAAALLFNQQALLIVGRGAPDTVTSISVVVLQIGIALGAVLGGFTVDARGVAQLPLTGLVFAAGSVVLLCGLRPHLPRRRAAKDR